jgi:hypothetical protein
MVNQHNSGNILKHGLLVGILNPGNLDFALQNLDLEATERKSLDFAMLPSTI